MGMVLVFWIQFSNWCKRIVSHPLFTWSITLLILINAVVVGLETYQGVYGQHASTFHLIDVIILWLFTVEITLKLVAARPTLRFFKDGWNVFDFIIVASGHLFVGNQFLTVLRILRVLRIFRTISVIPSLRRLVNALLLTLPSLGTIMILMIIVFYIYSVIGTVLYRHVAPDYFGTLQHTALTLFQMVTLESWASGVMRPVMEQAPWSWVYFVTFILVGTFIVLNLFVGVIVNNFQRVEAAEKELEEGYGNEQLKQEMILLREEFKDLKDKIQKFSEQ
jgi:voltage-gated sodium channel